MSKKLSKIIIAAIWLANGLYAKALYLVPRHGQIVARITGVAEYTTLTKIIGLGEIAMAIWILSGFRSRLNAIIQIAVIATMNIIEFILAPDLLLWGRANAFFAILLILFIYWSEFRTLKPMPVA